MKRSVLLIILIFVSVLLCACTPGGGEVTTDAVTTNAPETSTLPPETIAPDTEAVTTEDTTAPQAPETTEPPSVLEVKVYVYDALGKAHEHILSSPTLPSAALEAVDMTVGEDVHAELVGWEYSIAGEGERRPYDMGDPPAVTYEGMHIYPILEYSYRVRFLAGEGKFADGINTEFFVKSGESVSASELLGVMPVRAETEAVIYELAGFSYDGGEITAEAEFIVDRPMTYTAVYLAKDAEFKVIVRTEYGKLPSGGKSAEFKGNLADAEDFVSQYENGTYSDVRIGAALYKYSGTTLKKNGRVWTLDINWERISVGFTIVLDYGDGQQAVMSEIPENDKIVLPELERREDVERYYDFVGWRDERGHLYNGGYEILVTENMTFTSEFAPGAKKVYSIVFDTEIGTFANGSPVIVVEGHYGDVLIPPAHPEVSELTFGEVVYEFVGWDGEVPAVIGGDMSFTAVYKTPKPVYYLNFYVDGELYFSAPHYAGSALTTPDAPEADLGKIFSGWADMPELMPEADLDVYATMRDPEVVYTLDGETVSRLPAKYGTLVTLAEPAHKYGHTVSGWSTGDIALLDGNSFTMPAHDVLFEAVSAPNHHTVRYVIDGVEVYCDNVIYGEIYTVRGIEVKLGYDFSGWSCTEAIQSEPGGIVAIPDSDIVLIGSFVKSKYSVNYYIDGELVYSDEYLYGDVVTLRPSEEQPGCVFAWHSAGADLSLGAFEMPAGNVDVYGIFSSGDNYIHFTIDGVNYGSIRVNAGETVDLGYTPTKQGYLFSGWSCDEVDVESGIFVMPEGDIVLRGSFIPNAHDIIFIDIATETIISMSHLDYKSRFSLGDSIFCMAGKVSEGWILLEGNAIAEGEEYVMPDSNVIFGIVWEDCLTVEVEDGYHVPYYDLIGDEYPGCRYDEEQKTLYISDPALKVNGESEGVSVIYEYISGEQSGPF